VNKKSFVRQTKLYGENKYVKTLLPENNTDDNNCQHQKYCGSNIDITAFFYLCHLVVGLLFVDLFCVHILKSPWILIMIIVLFH